MTLPYTLHCDRITQIPYLLKLPASYRPYGAWLLKLISFPCAHLPMCNMLVRIPVLPRPCGAIIWYFSFFMLTFIHICRRFWNSITRPCHTWRCFWNSFPAEATLDVALRRLFFPPQTFSCMTLCDTNSVMDSLTDFLTQSLTYAHLPGTLWAMNTIAFDMQLNRTPTLRCNIYIFTCTAGGSLFMQLVFVVINWSHFSKEV